MAIWTVWENPRHAEAAPVRAAFVEDSFSWAAFLLAPLWLLANGMIVTLVLLMGSVAGSVALAVQAGAPPAVMGAGVAVALLWFGFEARALRRFGLARRGFALAGVVEAHKLEDAERRYFEARAERARILPPPIPGVAARPVAGRQ